MPTTKLRLLLLLALAIGCTKGGATGAAKADTGPTCRAAGGDAYAHVEQIVDAPDDWIPCREVKAHGFVVPGSIQQQIVDEAVVRSFELTREKRSLRVVHRGPVPDTFKENAETVVSGTLVRAGATLELRTHDGEDGIVAKCPSRYSAGQ